MQTRMFYVYFVYICKTHSHWNKYNNMTHLQVHFFTAKFSAKCQPKLKCVWFGLNLAENSAVFKKNKTAKYSAKFEPKSDR